MLLQKTVKHCTFVIYSSGNHMAVRKCLNGVIGQLSSIDDRNKISTDTNTLRYKIKKYYDWQVFVNEIFFVESKS